MVSDDHKEPDLETARRILELVVQEFEPLALKPVERVKAGFEDGLENELEAT